MTGKELGLIHMAAKATGLNDPQYRTALRNCGGVESAKSLTQSGFENVMALFEERGWRQVGQPENYWRGKVAARGSLCGDRLIYKIISLIGVDFPYTLEGMCKRISQGRVDQLDKLTPGEALNMVEALKAIAARQTKKGAVEAAPANGEAL